MITTSARIDIREFCRELQDAHGGSVNVMGDVTVAGPKTICLDTEAMPEEPFVMVKNISLTDEQLQALVDNHDYQAILTAKIRQRILAFCRVLFVEMEYLYLVYQKQVAIGRETSITEDQFFHYLEWEDDLRKLVNEYSGEDILWPEPEGWLAEKLEQHGIEYPPRL